MLRNTFEWTRKENVVKLNTHRQKRLEESGRKATRSSSAFALSAFGQKGIMSIAVHLAPHTTSCNVQRACVCVWVCVPCALLKCASVPWKRLETTFASERYLTRRPRHAGICFYFFLSRAFALFGHMALSIHSVQLCESARARKYHSVSKFLAKLSVAKCMAHRMNGTHMNLCSVHESTYSERIKYILSSHVYVSGFRVHDALALVLHSTVQVQPNTFTACTQNGSFWKYGNARTMGRWVSPTAHAEDEIETTTTELKFMQKIVCISNLSLSREKNNGKGRKKNIRYFSLGEGCFAWTCSRLSLLLLLEFLPCSVTTNLRALLAARSKGRRLQCQSTERNRSVALAFVKPEQEKNWCRWCHY